MGRIIGGNRLKLIWIRSFCSTKPHANNSSSSNSKALSNLDFITAAKILFNDSSKKKEFGLDFHLLQLFFVCLPSLAVYLVAQYARSEMRKMERKKQAEFEAQAKEMEAKAAEEKASNPELLKVRERLDKIEDAVKQIAVEFQKKTEVDTAAAPGERKKEQRGCCI